MKIRVRLILLLFLLTLIFLGVLMLQRSYEQKRLISLLKTVQVERESIFDKVLELKRAPMYSFSYDYSYWDDMVNFVTTGDKKWGTENLDSSLAIFKANAVWVYNLDCQLVYSVNNLKDDSGLLKEIPIPKAAISGLFVHPPFCHFFVNTPKGIMEIYGALIQPFSDLKRQSPGKGYFFCSRLWDNVYISELLELTGSSLVIADTVESQQLKSGENGVSFLRTLTGWDDKPLKYLIISVASKAIEGTKRAAIKISIFFIIFAVATLAIVYFFIAYWINTPLEFMSQALKQKDPAPLKYLANQSTEFGDISRLMDDFFKQRVKIVQEIAERKTAEEKLSQALQDEKKSREIVNSMLEDNNQIRERLEKSLGKLKEAQAQLIHAEKMEAVGRMASGVAHEVKNPLGIILQGINYFEGILSPEEKDNREILQMMKDSVKRADKIVRGLLDFSRVEEIKIDEQDLNTIIESSINLVQHKLKANSVEILCDLGKGLPKAPIDKVKIEQVFVNLFNNAADAMPTGGKLYIRSYLSELKTLGNRVGNRENDIFKLGDKVVIVEVEDTGLGIDEGIINKIFDPFFTTKNRTEGTGLGLSIVKSIIEMHSNSIDVESYEGKGTKFTIRFRISREV